ncbi:Transposase zinc-ribbon domain [Rodentibacter pneumotropicus]|uniref:Transposase zinc-ribbon domain n=1 Tax=Rodentibacter pneumotropicus TaxID=758 RepID=A0A448MM77_9PAST|nr:Transposase zinc-ribbon domain [Rodentibacter pneumotropicus]
MYVERKDEKQQEKTSPLLLSALRNLSALAIYDLSDTEILILLKNARWGNSHCFHTVQCPRCQIEHKAYFISSRKQWQCKHCQHRFSVKSGTIFQHTKLSLKSYYYRFIISLSIVKGFLLLTYLVILACNIKHHGHYSY